MLKEDTRTFYEQVVQRAIESIVVRLDEALALESLADDAAMSPFHFHRVFKGMVGETPLEFARRLRLERAAWRLSNSDTPVTELALEAGYETHEAFTRAFRSRFSISPSKFREQLHPRTVIPAACGVHFRVNGPVPAFTPRVSGETAMQVEITEVPQMRVATVRHVGPYNQIHHAFERLGAIAGPAGLFSASAPTMVALYHDIPEVTPLEQLRSDAGLVVNDSRALPAGLGEQTIPKGRYARAMHVGPYEQLGDAWARLMGEWLSASGERVGSGPSFEVYRNNPSTTRPEALETEMYVPLA